MFKNKKFLLGLIALLIIIFTLPLAVYLVKLRQEIRRKAQEPTCFIEEFDNTTYKDQIETTADWNTSLSRLQLVKEGIDRHKFPRITTDGTHSYLAYMSSDGVRVAKFRPDGTPVDGSRGDTEFGHGGVSNPISSYWAMEPVYDITLTQGGVYVLYHGNGLLQRLNAVTGKIEWNNIPAYQDPNAFFQLYYQGGGYTMTSDINGHVYAGGYEKKCDQYFNCWYEYYLIKMKNGGERTVEIERKILDKKIPYGSVDLVTVGSSLYLSWQENNRCFVKKYSQDTLEAKGGSLEINGCTSPISLTVEPGGKFYLLYHQENDYAVKKYDEQQNLLWGPVLLNINAIWPSLYYHSDQLYAVWQDMGGPVTSHRIQKLDPSNGNKLFPATGLVLKHPAWVGEGYLNMHGPVATIDDNGNAIAAYLYQGNNGYLIEVAGVKGDQNIFFRVSPPPFDSRYKPSGRGQSIAVASTVINIVSVTLNVDQTLNGGSIVYYLSADGGSNWEGPVSPGTEWVFAHLGKSLKWRADLATPDTSKTPWVDSLTLCYQSIIPTITPSPSATPTPTTTTTPGPTATPTPTSTPTPSVTPTPTTTPSPSPSPSPSPTPGPTATPTPTPVLECKDLKAYKKIDEENWQEITDLSTIGIGDKVYFVVEGLCDESLGITKAKFRITINDNQGDWQETTTQKDGHFYLEYEITTGGSYKVEAMVYNPNLDWR